ncbi:AGE family epimerase/isomerase [Sulfuriroseicoccus oceanibius]|uniref:AGE family epimerase/isomerase n=1 Tax=Sulfuriroseicoccus oceanibius TaxID=2707525 RepID=A0A6B3L5D5_9BACT|nr:AGE family epimerase/isomerase [Sulfuriroseicoccus oceanibius]QQL44277.1 AGE family epimerase/isomerase [Sulfuriroseicoccus oceanibius]
MSAYTTEELNGLRDFYRDSLLDDTLKFWLPDAIDKEHGGYLLMRDADGSLVDTDKSVWFQGRFATILGTLYNQVEPRQEWLDGAKAGVDFLRKHCIDDDGQMFFMVTREGKPLRKRRYFFSEAFAISGYCQLAKATGDEQLAQEARDLFKRCMEYADGTRPLAPKFTDERPTIGIGVPMIFLNIAQQLVDTVGCEFAESCIDKFVEDIRKFVKDDIECVMECLSPEGDIIDHFQERTLNPGHAIEGGWFILHEARRRGGDKDLEDLGLRMIDYMWKRGWDEQFGGIIYFKDVYDKPVMEYWQDMKFWWPQNEAVIATLLAYTMTGDEKWAERHRMIHEYAHKHFHDPEHGEWFGYLSRDNRVCSTLKGTHYKGPFHLPRMQTYCWQLLESLGTDPTLVVR